MRDRENRIGNNGGRISSIIAGYDPVTVGCGLGEYLAGIGPPGISAQGHVCNLDMPVKLLSQRWDWS